MLILEIMYFNPRSLTGATGGGIVAQLLEQFQSTLPRGSDADEHLLQAVLRISIHAPSRERPGAHPAPCRARHFNPRSLSGATEPSAVACDWSRYFNPRSLAGATLLCRLSSMLHLFQSTLPSGSDDTQAAQHLRRRISIHAPLRERLNRYFGKNQIFVISIHAPLRERRRAAAHAERASHFNPRSLAGATKMVKEAAEAKAISIHAPLRERLVMLVLVIIVLTHFNPRSLAGATVLFLSSVFFVIISIHAPLRERRHRLLQHLFFGWISIHAPSRERQ